MSLAYSRYFVQSHAGPSSEIVLRYPLLGIISIAVALFTAINLIPRDTEPEGALFWPAVTLSLGLMLAPALAAYRLPKSILRAEHLLVLAPIYWLLLDLIQGAYSLESLYLADIRRAFVGIGLFAVAVWIGSIGRPWGVPDIVLRSITRDLPANVYFYLTVASFLLGMLKFAIPLNFNVFEMLYYVGQGRWDAPWGRTETGGWDAFLDHLQYFGYLTPVLAVVVNRQLGLRSWRTFLCAAMTITMVVFLAQSGSRRVIGVVVGMALIFWILGHRPGLRLKQVLIVGVAIVALLAAMQVILEYRNIGLSAFVRGEAGSYIQRSDNEYVHVDDNFYRLCQVIELIPSTHSYVYHRYLIYVLVRPVPRVIWPNKPLDAGFDLSEALGDEEVSYSCSVVGELYMSLGFIGIALGGWLYGRLAAMANGLIAQCSTLGALVIYSIGAMALFSGIRSIVELVLVGYVILAWIALSKIFNRRLKKAS